MFMAPDSWKELYDNTLAQVRSGEIPMARLDDAVRRILRVKLRSGLFEAGKPSIARARRAVSSCSARQSIAQSRARRCASRSCC